jgi:hypothetical protein
LNFRNHLVKLNYYQKRKNPHPFHLKINFSFKYFVISLMDSSRRSVFLYKLCHFEFVGLRILEAVHLNLARNWVQVDTQLILANAILFRLIQLSNFLIKFVIILFILLSWLFTLPLFFRYCSEICLRDGFEYLIFTLKFKKYFRIRIAKPQIIKFIVMVLLITFIKNLILKFDCKIKHEDII